MSQLILADVSEWQGQIDWAAYAAGGYPAAVARINYGTGHVDTKADQNITGMRAHLRCRGYYLYLVAGQDPAAQAAVFARVLTAHGGIQPGEWVCVDVEEGAGDQEANAAACLAALNRQLGLTQAQNVEYSGLYFVASHGGWIPGTTRWVAAYQPDQPQVGEALWQCTDHRSFPGIANACDGSLYNGSVDQLLTLISPPAAAPIPTPAAPQPPTPLGDNVQSIEIPNGIRLDAAGFTCVDVPLPSGITPAQVVGVKMDVASSYDPQSWKWCQGELDFKQPTPGHARVVFKGDPGQFFTGRLIATS